MAKYHFKAIREPEFQLIKTMATAGIKTGLICKATKRSWLVVQKIAESGTIEQYKKAIRDYTEKTHNKQSKPVKEVPVTGNYPRIVALLDTIVTRQITMQQDIDRIKGRLLIIK